MTAWIALRDYRYRFSGDNWHFGKKAKLSSLGRPKPSIQMTFRSFYPAFMVDEPLCHRVR
jgi:hypothetical protein